MPLLRHAFCREVKLFFDWYNSLRPHTTLKGATPDEVYFSRRLACRLPRFEPRPDWPRGSPCALPQVLIKGQPGVRLNVSFAYFGGRGHLPVITISALPDIGSSLSATAVTVRAHTSIVTHTPSISGQIR